MIKWLKYFDKIICISYCESLTRRELMNLELKRIGILDSPIFEWLYTYNGPFEKIFKDMLDPENVFYSESTLSCILGHLNAVKKAYYTGCKNILIIEDSERFLKDLNKLEKILLAKPLEDQYDVIIYDKFINTNIKEEYLLLLQNKNNYLNLYYINYNIKILSTSCYCLSRKAMEIIISLTDNYDINTFNTYFNYKSLNSTWKKICVIPNLAVQATFLNINNIPNPKEESLHIQEVYEMQNINFNDYMMKQDNSNYNYGDYIEE